MAAGSSGTGICTCWMIKVYMRTARELAAQRKPPLWSPAYLWGLEGEGGWPARHEERAPPREGAASLRRICSSCYRGNKVLNEYCTSLPGVAHWAERF